MDNDQKNPEDQTKKTIVRAVNGQEVCKLRKRDVEIELVSDDADVLTLSTIALDLYDNLNQGEGLKKPKYIS